MYTLDEKGKRSDARETPAAQGGHARCPFSVVPEISGHDISRSAITARNIGGYPVTDETPKETVKDERDLIIEDLKARLDRIESDYQIKIGDYQKANGELWARLHPAQQEAAGSEQAPEKNPYEAMLDSFNAAMGIKKEK